MCRRVWKNRWPGGKTIRQLRPNGIFRLGSSFGMGDALEGPHQVGGFGPKPSHWINPAQGNTYISSPPGPRTDVPIGATMRITVHIMHQLYLEQNIILYQVV